MKLWKKLLILYTGMALLFVCAACAPATDIENTSPSIVMEDGTVMPEMRISNGMLEYLDESGAWQPVAKLSDLYQKYVVSKELQPTSTPTPSPTSSPSPTPSPSATPTPEPTPEPPQNPSPNQSPRLRPNPLPPLTQSKLLPRQILGQVAEDLLEADPQVVVLPEVILAVHPAETPAAVAETVKISAAAEIGATGTIDGFNT